MYEIKSEFYDFLMIDIIYLKFVIFGFFYVMNLDDLYELLYKVDYDKFYRRVYFLLLVFKINIFGLNNF